MNRRRGVSGRGRRTGMTLIEVLLALTLLAMGLGALLVGTTRCLAVVAQARNYETARRLLARVAAEYPLDPDAEEGIGEGDDGGAFDDVPGFSWTRTVRPVGEPEDGLFEVRTSVNWSDAGRDSRETLTTWIYAPQSVQP